MGSGCPGGPGPALFLLLVLSPAILSSGGFLYQLPSWKDFHEGKRLQRRNTDLDTACKSPFNVFFVLDASTAMRNIWKEIYKYVDVIIQKYRNYCCKNHQFSFITYSTGAQTLMELTSDRAAIQDGLNRLYRVTPAGSRDIDAGFAKANEQIQKVYNSGSGMKNLIITLVGGQLKSKIFQNVLMEAGRAEKMKSTLLGIGLNNYNKGQVQNIVQYRDLTYFANGLKEMAEYNTSVAKHSCYTLMKLNTKYVCVGEKYDTTFFLRNFGGNKYEILCAHKFGDAADFVYSVPTLISGDEVVCKGHVFNQPGQSVTADLSLDYGHSTMNEHLTYTSKECDPIIEPTDPPTNVITKETNTIATQKTPESAVVTTNKTPASTTVKVKNTKLTVVPKGEPPVGPLIYMVLAPTLVIVPLLICCICCYGMNKEQKQASCICVTDVVSLLMATQRPPEEKPPEEPRNTCPLVIMPCSCQEDSISRIEGKLDSLCNIVLGCHQGPRDEGWCINLNLLNPHQVDMSCDPNPGLQPNLECFRLNSSCSLFQNTPPICSQPQPRMLPLTSSSDEVLSSTLLPLPPP